MQTDANFNQNTINALSSPEFAKDINTKTYTVKDYGLFDEVSTKKELDGKTLKPNFDFIKAANEHHESQLRYKEHKLQNDRKLKKLEHLQNKKSHLKRSFYESV